jgi:hypothetical protein
MFSIKDKIDSRRGSKSLGGFLSARLIIFALIRAMSADLSCKGALADGAGCSRLARKSLGKAAFETSIIRALISATDISCKGALVGGAGCAPESAFTSS